MLHLQIVSYALATNSREQTSVANFSWDALSLAMSGDLSTSLSTVALRENRAVSSLHYLDDDFPAACSRIPVNRHNLLPGAKG